MNASCAFDRRPKKRYTRRSLHGLLERLEPRLMPSTYVVNSTFDQPAADPTKGAETSANTITFRSAIQAANAHPNDASGPDRIEFNIPGQGVQTIVPYSLWPVITDPVVIDGYTQPGAKPNTLDVGDNAVLKINLYDQFGFGSALTIKAGGSTVRGLDITNFGQHGLTLTDKGGNVIAGNFLGLPPSGSPSISDGIALSISKGADGNTIGGTAPADRNVISGNLMGVRIAASSNNIIQGNYIGLVPSGAEPLGNGQGILVTSGVAPEQTGPATGNLIGGTVSGARNVISSNGAGIIFGGNQASLTSGNLVEGDYIGTDALGGGNQHFRNNGPGVLLDNGTGANADGARMNTIGGSTAAARNIISGNIDGVVVATAATDNLIQGNYIGTDVTGALGFRDSISGITVHGNRTTIVDNLISGVGADGIFIQGGDQSTIQGNLIGTNAAGTAAVSNDVGIHLSGANDVTIGGTTASARNVISGNQLSGVFLDGFGVGNRILGNLIGTAIDGTSALGNGVDGIMINFNTVGSPSGDTQIGGPDPGAGNVIAHNAYNGVDILNSTGTSKFDGTIEANTIFSNVLSGITISTLNVRDPHFSITRNSIFSNGRLGIDLGADGVTPNDSRGHVGPNNYQNFPILTSVMASNAATNVSGTLNSTPNTNFRIEFFANAAADPSGHGQGQTFLGFTNVVTDAGGNASFNNVVLPSPPAGESFVAATATDPSGNTSEFSATVGAKPLQTSADLAISMTANPSPVDAGGDVTYTITVADKGPDKAINAALTTAVPTSTTFVSFTAPSGWTTSTPMVGSPGIVSATIPTLDRGDSAVFSFVVHVNSDTPGNTTLTAKGSTTSDTPDPDTTNNSASASAIVSSPLEQTDLAIAMSVTPTTVPQGQTLAFTITVTNNGPVDASNVVMTTNTPSETTFQSLTAPSGWSTATPPVGGTGSLKASIASLAVGASAMFAVTVGVNSTTTAGSVITGIATAASGTPDSNPGNNRAQASATVAQVLTANLTVAISGNINPATVGQDVTYTITVSSSGDEAATGTVVHVTVPGSATMISLGGGTRTPVGEDINFGTLAAGATRQFQVVARPMSPGTITLTAGLTADAGVNVVGPASVTTTVVGAAPGATPPPTGATPPPAGATPPPTVVRAVRYGFHKQPTLLVVTYSKDMNPDGASNVADYSVVGTVKRIVRTVPITTAYYNPQTHQATLRLAEKIYLYRPWRLMVGRSITDLSGLGLDPGGDGAPGGGLAIKMDRGTLVGRASQAPGASQVGVAATPSGPLATRAKTIPLAGGAKPLTARSNARAWTSGHPNHWPTTANLAANRKQEQSK
jgi:uncharacterized repeat protein (TIGR01451 family)